MGFYRTRTVGGLMDIIKVHWKNKMLKTCTVVCLVQIIISKCASIVWSVSFAKARITKTMNKKCQMVRLWQMMYMNCFRTLLDFKGL